MRTKNQHYVPQSYLRLFSEDEKYIWVFDKIEKVIRHQKIEGTGAIKNFYLSIRHPQPLDTRTVTHLEGEGVSIIKKIDSREEFGGEDMGKLLNYISLQLLRTPASRERIENTFQIFWKELRARYNDLDIKNRKKVEEIARGFLNDQNMHEVDPREFLNGKVRPSFPKELFIDSIKLHGNRIAEILSRQNWKFLFSKSDPWVTSDDPFSLLGENGEKLVPSLSSNIVKIIPLSKTTLVAIDGKNFSVEFKRMPAPAVLVINLATASKAHRYVYSGSKSLLEEIMNKLTEFEANPLSFANKI